MVGDDAASLDIETVRWLHRAGEVSADTATLWLLLVSARHRLLASGSAPARLAARVHASRAADPCLLRCLRTEHAMRRWRRAARVLENMAPSSHESTIQRAADRLRGCPSVDALVWHYLAARRSAAADPVERGDAAAIGSLVSCAAYWRRFGELVAGAAARARGEG